MLYMDNKLKEFFSLRLKKEKRFVRYTKRKTKSEEEI